MNTHLSLLTILIVGSAFSATPRLWTTDIRVDSDCGVYLSGGYAVSQEGIFSNTQTVGFLTHLHPDGALDRKFSHDGFALINFGDFSSVRSFLLDKGGLVLGGSFGALQSFMTRLTLPRGVVDKNFNTLAHKKALKGIDQIVPTSKGLLAITHSSDCTIPIELRKFHRNGEPDAAFGESGVVALSTTDFPCSVTAAHIDSKDRIILIKRNGDTSGITIARFDSKGHSDPSFANQGTVSLTQEHFGVRYIWYRSSVVLKDSLLFEVFTSAHEGRFARLDEFGRLDESFGTHGILTSPGSTVLQAHGSSLFNYSYHQNGMGRMFKLDSKGNIDPAYGKKGEITFHWADYDAAPSFGVCQDSSQIVPLNMGPYFNPDHDIALVKITPNGQIDTAFGTEGWVKLKYDNIN